MAIVNNRIHGVLNDLIKLVIVNNDANGTVQSATPTNSQAVYTGEYTVWLIADPATRVVITVPPNTAPPFTNLPGNVRYSPFERPAGDPRATNFDYSFRAYV